MRRFLSGLMGMFKTRYGRLLTIWVSFGAFTTMTISLSYLLELWTTPTLLNCRAFAKNYGGFVDLTFARLLLANWCIAAVFFAWNEVSRRFLAMMGEWVEDALTAVLGAFLGVALLSLTESDDYNFLFSVIFYTAQSLLLSLAVRRLIAPTVKKSKKDAVLWTIGAFFGACLALVDPAYYPWTLSTTPAQTSECMVGQPSGAL